MSRAVRELRAALERFLMGEHNARLARMRDPGDDREPASRASARWLLSNAGRDALCEALEQGELEPFERERLEGHVRLLPYQLDVLDADRALRAALARAALPTGAQLVVAEAFARVAATEDTRSRMAAAREIEQVLAPITLAHAEALLRAEPGLLVVIEPPGERPPQTPPASSLIVSAFDPDVLSPKSRDLPHEPWLEIARAFLQATEAAAEDAVGFLVRRVHAGGPRPLHTLVHALRATELDSEVGRRARSLRVSAWLRALGFEAELHRMRGEVDRCALGPGSSVLLLDPPSDVRVAQSVVESGLVSDACAAEGVARGLAHALLHPALPCGARWPASASTSGAFGMLGMLAWADREQLARAQGLTDLQVERISRLLGTFVLLWTRAAVALALVPAFEPKAARERLDAQAQALSAAWCVEVPPFAVGLFVQDRVAARVRALEAMCGLAAAVGLRERHDADWHRNPRTSHTLRAAAARGAGLGPQAFALELGAALNQAAGRANELVA